MYVSNADDILKQIEELRLEMTKVQEGKPLTDPKVVTVSQVLDMLLNKYHEEKKAGQYEKFIG